jgi:predicted transposase YbfD/YdcC
VIDVLQEVTVDLLVDVTYNVISIDGKSCFPRTRHTSRNTQADQKKDGNPFHFTSLSDSQFWPTDSQVCENTGKGNARQAEGMKPAA